MPYPDTVSTEDLWDFLGDHLSAALDEARHIAARLDPVSDEAAGLVTLQVKLTEALRCVDVPPAVKAKLDGLAEFEPAVSAPPEPRPPDLCPTCNGAGKGRGFPNLLCPACGGTGSALRA